jgi:hypothetical protein
VSSGSLDSRTPVQPTGRRALDLFKNPSYPQREHLHEKAKLEESLRSTDELLHALQKKLSALGNHSERARFERLYFQMLGARDQMAEAVRRLPMETGDLYDEDRERYEQAMAAFDRAYRQWDSASG